MRKFGFSTKSVRYLAAGLAITLASISFAVYTNSDAAQTETPPAAVSATVLQDETSTLYTSEPPATVSETLTVAYTEKDNYPPAPAVDTAARAPGLASPPPSSLQAAAAALAAKHPGRAVKVGIQAGHWKAAEQPGELASLRTATGAEGKGWREVDVNLDVSRKITEILSPYGIQVDLLPATVPADYRADAFVSIHGDANPNRSLSGFKIARATGSAIPGKDDALVEAITRTYKDATGLSWHADTITQNMLRYYAFNQKLRHSVNPETPSVIVELGFLTNPSDLEIVTNQSDKIAESIALGILNFLVQ